MQIRQAEMADAGGMAHVYVRSGRAAFSGRMPQGDLDAMDPQAEHVRWHDWLAQAGWPESGALVAENEDGIVGFVVLDRAPESSHREGEPSGSVAEIGKLYSVPEVWGTGTGKRLMTSALEALTEAGYRQATLWVLQSNDRARRFYEAFGWGPDGVASDDGDREGYTLTRLRYRRVLGEPATGATAGAAAETAYEGAAAPLAAVAS
ncbi:GNAT family N-acetyltransferase [Streptomyces sp. ODS28]|uniref:GNAT family N-acetyltransferase n=1 Tax=Streptomyces sp. ODS28 TaxID=3136688 RepID=UPI0031E8B9B3